MDVMSEVIRQLGDLQRRIAALERTELHLPAGTASAPGLTLGGDANTGIYQSAADNLDFATGGVQRLNLNSSGVNVPGRLRLGSAFLNLGGAPALTINASGAITVTCSYHQVDTYGGGATDDLDTINGGALGDVLILRSVSNVRDVTLKDGTGNLHLAGDFTLSTFEDRIMLIQHSGGEWYELSRSDNW